MFSTKRPSFFGLLALALALIPTAAIAAPPALSTIQDTLYRADGTPFSGLLFIDWCSFETGDRKNVSMQSVVVPVVNGVLRVQLAPTTNASTTVWYKVRYNSDGRVEFTEYWAVPPSSTPLPLRSVRLAAPPGPSSTGPTPAPVVQMADIPGLAEELSSRMVKGTAYQPGRAAVINSAGMVDGAVGNPGDCIRVDGTSGPCGSGGTVVSGPSFIDGEAPAGATDGTNLVFTLADAPSPAGSLMLFRNGVLQKAGLDYTISGNIVAFGAGSAPASGDVLSAVYRLDPTATVNSGLAGGALTGSYPNPSLAGGVVTDFNVSPTAGIAESKLLLNYPTHPNSYDPTSEQKSAMAGTSGLPSSTNRFVTEQDARLTDLRAPSGHSLLGPAHSDTMAATPLRGDLVVGQSSGVWTRLGIGPPNRCLMSNGADAVWNTCLFTGFAAGSVPFVDSTGSLSHNSSRLFWDNTNRRLGIGTNSPSSTLHIQDATPGTPVTTVTVRAAAGQGTSPLEHWVDINGLDLAAMEADGSMTAGAFRAASTPVRAAWRDAGSAADPSNPANGDAWFQNAEHSRKTRDAGQTHTQPQVICSSTGTTTSATTLTSAGTCSIPANLLHSGDRVEIRFDWSHQGTGSDFLIDLTWAGVSIFQAAATQGDAYFSGRAEGGAYATGIQWGLQSWGNGPTGFLTGGANVVAAFSSPVLIDFRGSLSSVSSDTISLRNFTVIRYPAQLNP